MDVMELRRRILSESGGVPPTYRAIYMAGSRSSSAFVNTEYVPTLQSVIEFSYNRINNSGSNVVAGCANTDTGRGGFIVGSTPNDNLWWYRILEGDKSSSPETLNVVHTIKIWRENTTNNLLRDNVLYQYTNSSTMVPAQPLYLFGRRQQNSSIGQTMQGNIGRVRIVTNGVIVRDMVPCVRKSDNVVGFYDICKSICSVTHTPFYVPYTSGNNLVEVTT